MPSKPDLRGVNVSMLSDEKQTLKILARAKGFRSVSEYIRSLIEKDSADTEYQIRFDVKWGGDRTADNEE